MMDNLVASMAETAKDWVLSVRVAPVAETAEELMPMVVALPIR